jgi:Meiotically Up-regulated Gene 113 (MUG113) protein
MRKPVVYIVKCNEFYKIGVADDMKSRLINLQTGNPYPIELIKTYDVPWVEKEVHEILKMANLHVRNEWFAMNDATLKTIMEYIELHEKYSRQKAVI